MRIAFAPGLSRRRTCCRRCPCRRCRRLRCAFSSIGVKDEGRFDRILVLRLAAAISGLAARLVRILGPVGAFTSPRWPPAAQVTLAAPRAESARDSMPVLSMLVPPMAAAHAFNDLFSKVLSSSSPRAGGAGCHQKTEAQARFAGDLQGRARRRAWRLATNPDIITAGFSFPHGFTLTQIPDLLEIHSRGGPR